MHVYETGSSKLQCLSLVIPSHPTREINKVLTATLNLLRKPHKMNGWNYKM